MSEFERICELVRDCGQMIREADRAQLQVDSKSGRANFVTAYDKAVQVRLEAGLKEILPEAAFIGEEGSSVKYSATGKFFIVDPIDGTMNFIKDYHLSAISVALITDGCAEFGVVYNPYTDELFTAQRGHGAFCNGRSIRVSSAPLNEGIVLFGTAPYNPELCERSFRLAYTCCRTALDVRRSGSAALDLCAIAAGRAEFFFELSLSPWDYAAGGLLVEEAGGSITTADGQPIVYDRPCSVLARGSGVGVTRVSDLER